MELKHKKAAIESDLRKTMTMNLYSLRNIVKTIDRPKNSVSSLEFHNDEDSFTRDVPGTEALVSEETKVEIPDESKTNEI